MAVAKTGAGTSLYSGILKDLKIVEPLDGQKARNKERLIR